jgi:hypothetical protein
MQVPWQVICAAAMRRPSPMWCRRLSCRKIREPNLHKTTEGAVGRQVSAASGKAITTLL